MLPQLIIQPTLHEPLSQNPLSSILKQLKTSRCIQGDYVKLTHPSLHFDPIYKLSSLALPNSNTDTTKKSKDPLRNSLKSRTNTPHDTNLVLSSGSQIFLKLQDPTLSQCKIQLVRPYLPHLYVQLYLPARGYINCINNKIVINYLQEIQSIWLCQMINIEDHNKEDQYVCFMNFSARLYLYLDNSGILNCTTRQIATLFTIDVLQSSKMYNLTAHNQLTQLMKNKSNYEIQRIISKNVMSSNKQQSLQVELCEVDDQMMTLHHELIYAKGVLEERPMLSIVVAVLKQLVYYHVEEFLEDDSLISEHIQRLLFEYGIVGMIGGWFDGMMKKQCVLQDEEGNWQSMKKEAKRIGERDKDNEQYNMMMDCVKAIHLLCLNNQNNSEVFLSSLDYMIKQSLNIQHHRYAAQLIKGNYYFLSQFHKRNWYKIIIERLSSISTINLLQTLQLLTLFCNHHQHGTYTMPIYCNYLRNTSRNCLPHISNQLLVYHTIKQSQLSTKCMLFELYQEGMYVFVQDTRNKKQVQLHTFFEGQQISYSRKKQQSQRKQVKKKQSLQEIVIRQMTNKSNQQQINQNMLVAQLQLVCAMCNNCNYIPLMNYGEIIAMLVPYCYKNNFPVLQNYVIKSLILRLALCFDPVTPDLSIRKLSLVGIAYIEKQKGNLKLMKRQSMGQLSQKNNQNRQNRKHGISKPILLEMFNSFTLRCKNWMNAMRKNTLTIETIYTGHKQQCLMQWLRLIKKCLSMRLIKVKAKKSAQFMQYVATLFKQVQKDETNKQTKQKQSIEQSTPHLNNFLLQIIRYNPDYDIYLRNLKIDRNYENQLLGNQIMGSMMSFQTKNVWFVLNKDKKRMTKIRLVQLFTKNNLQQMIKQERQIDGDRKMWKKYGDDKNKDKDKYKDKEKVRSFQQKELIEMKILAAQLLGLMILCTNQQLLEQAVQSLVFIIKNPSAFSSFGLEESFPKYHREYETRQILIQQWYLTSNCCLFDSYTMLLRLLYDESMIHQRNLNELLLLDNLDEIRDYNKLVQIVKSLKKMVQCGQSWLRGGLIDKYGHNFMNLRQLLAELSFVLWKTKQEKQIVRMQRVVTNLRVIQHVRTIVEIVGSVVVVERKSDVVGKETVLVSSVRAICQEIKNVVKFYVLSTNGNKLTMNFKVIVSIFGKHFSQFEYFSQFFTDIFLDQLSSRNCNSDELLRHITIDIMGNFLLSYDRYESYFELWLTLSDTQFLKHCYCLWYNHIVQMDSVQAQKLIEKVKRSVIGKNKQTHAFGQSQTSESQHSKSRYVFSEIILRLIDLHANYFPIIEWFKVNILCPLLTYQCEQCTNTTNRYMLNITTQTISKDKIIVMLIFKLCLQESKKVSQIYVEEMRELAVQYLECQLLKCKSRNIGGEDNGDRQLKLYQLEYLEYMVLYAMPLGQFVREFYQDCQLKEIALENIEILKHYQKNKVNQLKEELVKVEKLVVGNESVQFFEPPKAKQYSIRNRKKVSNEENKKYSSSISLTKWQKALKNIKESKNTDQENHFLDDLLKFANIYSLREGADLDFVINCEDLAHKLIEASLNFTRLNMGIENQVFILKQVIKLLRSNRKTKKGHNKAKDNKNGYQLVGSRMLDSLITQNKIIQKTSKKKQCFVQYQDDNILVLSLKLQIIFASGCFIIGQTEHLPQLSHLVELLKYTGMCYQQSLNFLELLLEAQQGYFRTSELLETTFMPFEIVLDIICNQVESVSIGRQLGAELCDELTKFQAVIDFDQGSQLKKYLRKDVQQLRQTLQKQFTISSRTRLQSNKFISQLLGLKK